MPSALPPPSSAPAGTSDPPPPPRAADEPDRDEPTTATEATVTFASLGLRDELLGVLDELGYEEPTGIQSEAIEPLLAGRDVLGQAATGTGKTAAFALPLLQRMGGRDERPKHASALVLAPTRELAMQVSEAIHTYGRDLRTRVVPVYGGQPVWRQVKALRQGVDVVVATPGRAVDLLERGELHLDDVATVVLDEADEMLDMGFAEDLERILAATPDQRQTTLFSATLPKRIEGLAASHMHDPVRITVRATSSTSSEQPRIREVVHVVARHHKAAALGRVLDVEAPDAAIVFCRTRKDVDDLTATMNGRGYRAEALHGGLTQQQRDQVMERLRNGTTDLLVATDVAARGLDVDHLTHVINHALPTSPESYVHRIGRVGRAGREGVAISLVEPRETSALKAIERHVGRRLGTDPLPTVADLRAHRRQVQAEAVRERLLAGELDVHASTLRSLTEEFDVSQVALAAIAVVADELVGTPDEREIPDAELASRGGRHKGGRDKGGKDRREDRGGGGRRDGNGSAGTVWIGLGSEGGMRPGDLVGAIANETSLRGKDIGRIKVQARFSLVDVPADAVDEVIDALSSTKVRGRRVNVRRDRVGPRA